MTDFRNDIEQHEALAERIERTLERVSARQHKTALKLQPAAIREDLDIMRRAQWLSRDEGRGPWIELKC